MASPISFTIELRRCWTTERVMGSIFADILTRSLVRSTRACDFLERARRRIDDRMDIGVGHRGGQCHQPVARGQHATIEKGAGKYRLTLSLLLAQIGRAI